MLCTNVTAVPASSILPELLSQPKAGFQGAALSRSSKARFFQRGEKDQTRGISSHGSVPTQNPTWARSARGAARVSVPVTAGAFCSESLDLTLTAFFPCTHSRVFSGHQWLKSFTAPEPTCSRGSALRDTRCVPCSAEPSPLKSCRELLTNTRSESLSLKGASWHGLNEQKLLTFCLFQTRVGIRRHLFQTVENY